jgi:hypothetical protein
MLLIILLVLVLLFISKPQTTYKYSSCQPTTHPIVKDVFDKYNIKYTKSDNWDIYLPCKGKIPNNIPTGGRIGYLEEPWTIGDRSNLWTTLISFGGRDYAKSVMPTTYRLPKDLHLLKKEYVRQLYFLKSHKQRQEGLKLTVDLNEMLQARDKGYIQAQVNITNALTYQGYKLNFRIYLLTICNYHNNVTRNYYLFHDGIVSYASKLLAGNESNFEAIVASGYTAKEHYKKGFPVLISQLEKQFPPGRMNKIWNEIIYRSQLLVRALNSKICQQNRLPHRTHFQIFGLDYMFNEDYRAYLLEANAGPGMDPFSAKDKEMRMEVYQGIYQILDVLPGTSKFIKLSN